MKQHEETNILNFQFSIIGRIDSIYNNIDKLISMFPDFNKRNIQFDVKPNSIPTNCYIMMNENCSISIHENRIDFGVKTFNEDSSRYFYDFIARLNNEKFEIDISRIAINYDYFVKYNDGEVSRSIISGVNIFPDENKPEELLLRLNFPFNINETKFNNLITLQKNYIQNNTTFEKIEALIISIDINSSINKETNFKFNNIKDYFDEMILKVKKRINEINNLIHGE